MSKEPWEIYPSIWKSKASFFTYLRGHLRQIWSRYPAKLEWKKAQAFEPGPGYTGRAKKLAECFYCKEHFPVSSTEVDHVEMAGACNDWDTAAEFMHNLLDCGGEWRIACKPCHKIKSYAERMGFSFEEAHAVKQAIEFMKEPKQVVLDFLASKGYTGNLVGTAEKRRAIIETIFKEQTNDSA